MLSLNIFSLHFFLTIGRSLQALISYANHLLGGRENLFCFVETHVQKLNQIIDGGIRQAIDIRDSVLIQGIRLLRSDTFDRGQRH